MWRCNSGQRVVQRSPSLHMPFTLNALLLFYTCNGLSLLITRTRNHPSNYLNGIARLEDSKRKMLWEPGVGRHFTLSPIIYTILFVNFARFIVHCQAPTYTPRRYFSKYHSSFLCFVKRTPIKTSIIQDGLAYSYLDVGEVEHPVTHHTCKSFILHWQELNSWAQV